MATSYVSYVGDGVTTDFNVTIGYLATAHVTVNVNAVSSSFTWLSPTQVRMDVAPANLAAVKVLRTTPTTPLVDFVDGAVLFESDLDNSALQAIYIAAEAVDNVGSDTAGDAAAAAASAAAALVSEAAADTSATNAAASAALAATFDPGTYTSTAAQTVIDDAQDVQIALKAPIASPTFTGTPLSTTPAADDNSTKIATTAYVDDGVATAIAGVSAGTTFGTAVASTSGTEIDFNSLPSGINRIEISGSGVSTNSTGKLFVRLGDIGGIEVSGYNSIVSSGTVQTSATTSFLINQDTGASYTYNFNVVLLRNTGNEWTFTASCYTTTGQECSVAAGGKTLTAELDRVRIGNTGGDTFDAGSLRLNYEV